MQPISNNPSFQWLSRLKSSSTAAVSTVSPAAVPSKNDQESYRKNQLLEYRRNYMVKLQAAQTKLNKISGQKDWKPVLDVALDVEVYRAAGYYIGQALLPYFSGGGSSPVVPGYVSTDIQNQASTSQASSASVQLLASPSPMDLSLRPYLTTAQKDYLLPQIDKRQAAYIKQVNALKKTFNSLGSKDWKKKIDLPIQMSIISNQSGVLHQIYVAYRDSSPVGKAISNSAPQANAISAETLATSAPAETLELNTAPETQTNPLIQKIMSLLNAVRSYYTSSVAALKNWVMQILHTLQSIFSTSQNTLEAAQFDSMYPNSVLSSGEVDQSQQEEVTAAPKSKMISFA